MSVCLLATLHKNFQTDLHEIFREGWQSASEQMIKFWGLEVAIRIRAIRNTDQDPNPDTVRIRHNGKTCLGGGMHCPSA